MRASASLSIGRVTHRRANRPAAEAASPHAPPHWPRRWHAQKCCRLAVQARVGRTPGAAPADRLAAPGVVRMFLAGPSSPPVRLVSSWFSMDVRVCFTTGDETRRSGPDSRLGREKRDAIGSIEDNNRPSVLLWSSALTAQQAKTTHELEAPSPREANQTPGGGSGGAEACGG